MESKTGRRGEEWRNSWGKKARRFHSERHAYPRRGKAEAVEAILHRCQTERSRKAFWDTEQADRYQICREGTSIAS
jgi:hypothetical protein